MRILHVSCAPGFDGHHNRIVNETVGLSHAGHDVDLDFQKIESDLTTYDIIHTHDVEGTRLVEHALERMTGAKPKFVQGVHFNAGYSGQPARVASNADAVICVSEHDAAELRAANPDKADIIRCIYTGVDPAKYEKSNDTHGRIVVGCYAGKGTRKGLDVLLKAAEDLPGIQFEVIGSGNDTDNVRFIPFEAGSDIAPWLSGLDIYVQPSRAEALGTTLLEAGATGLACVGTRVGGIPEVIYHGNTGLLCEPDNAESLAMAISILAADGMLRHKYGMNLRNHVREHFTIDQMVSGVEAIYKGEQVDSE